ncbi:MAG: DUF6475 domain-containing protein [Pseudomonadota bacterium]
MTKNELVSFGKLWAGMAQVYDKTISDAGIAMAFAALEKYDLQDIRRAINAHVADPSRGQYIAKPADLILHIDGDPESRSLQAWSIVEGSVKRVGPHQTVVFDDAGVMAAIDDMGGWIRLCGVSGDELPFVRQEFVKRYKGYLSRPPVTYPPQLIGISDSHNMQHIQNYKADPVLIGNSEKALQIMNSGNTARGGTVSLSQLMDRMKLAQDTKQLEN